ncbi:GAF domain-containing protein [Candidatus Sumerlaeota bacterium]|nr:GAF domain-containing protein [Candidatus Sumerlaeota bacterium]
MQMQLQRIKALRSIDMAISGSMDIRVTIMIILDAVITRLKIDAADILTYDRQTHMLDYCDGRGFRTNALRHTRLRVGSGYAGLAALNRKTVKVADLRRSSGEFVRSHHLLRENFVSYFAVPLVAKGELKGVIELFHRSEIEPDDDWFDFLETLANQAALAIEDARLYQNLQQSNSDLTRAVENTLEGWVRSLDLRDQEPEGHTQRVTRMALRLARLMNFDDLELVHVRRGAMRCSRRALIAKLTPRERCGGTSGRPSGSNSIPAWPNVF